MNPLLHKRYGARGKMMKSRWMAREIASWSGYFWLECKLCGEHFAGFETWPGGVAITEQGTFGVCSRTRCKEDGAIIKAAMHRKLEEEFDRQAQAEYASVHRNEGG